MSAARMDQHFAQLVAYKAYADLRAETAKTYLGVMWWILDPVILMAVFYVVFGVLLGTRTENFASFLLVGLISWRWFHNTVAHGSGSILGNRILVMHAAVPKVFFPLVTILTDLAKFAVVFAILLLYLALSGSGSTAAYAFVPFVLGTELLFIATVTCLCAAVIPFLPDLRVAIDHLLMIGLFVSGVFYSLDMVPAQYRDYLVLNPMATIVEAQRAVLLRGEVPNVRAMMGVLMLSVAIGALAYVVLRRYDKIYPKLVLQ